MTEYGNNKKTGGHKLARTDKKTVTNSITQYGNNNKTNGHKLARNRPEKQDSNKTNGHNLGIRAGRGNQRHSGPQQLGECISEGEQGQGPAQWGRTAASIK